MTDKDQAARDWPLNDPRGLHKLGPICACELCGTATLHTATKRCDACWELESRIHANPQLTRRILNRLWTQKAKGKPEPTSKSKEASKVEAVADGWKLVPIKPTEDMLFKMAEVDGHLRGDRDHPMLTQWEDYWNMALDASPAPPASQQPEPTSKGEPVSEEIAVMLGETLAFLRDPAVYRGKHWDSMTNEQRKQAFTKLDGGAAGFAKKLWTWRHFDMGAEDIGVSPQHRETQEAAERSARISKIDIDRLVEDGWLWDGRNLSAPQEASKPEPKFSDASKEQFDAWEEAGEFRERALGALWEQETEIKRLSKEASKVEAVADERQPSDGDYLRWAEQAGAKVNWDFESASSARVVFLTASQWGRFCDKVRALYLHPSQPEPTSKGNPVAWLRNFTDPQPHAVTDLKYRTAADAAAGVEYLPVYAASQQWALSDEQISEWALRMFEMDAIDIEIELRRILAASSGSKRDVSSGGTG